MTFKEDTKKILDFFDNKELQDIFEKNFIHKQKIKDVIKEVIELIELSDAQDGEKHLIISILNTKFE